MIPSILTLTCLVSLLLWLKRRWLLIRAMEWSLYVWVLRYIIPYIRLTLYYPSFTGNKFAEGYKHLKPGDILLSKDNKKLSTFCIPGTMAHAAMFLGKRSRLIDFEIAEMVASGFNKIDFFDLCKESDRVIILRCKDWSYDYVKDVIVPTCLSYQDVGYDCQFVLGWKTLYCSELPIASDLECRLQVNKSDLLGLGHPYIAPDDLMEASNVEIIWDSDQCNK